MTALQAAEAAARPRAALGAQGGPRLNRVAYMLLQQLKQLGGFGGDSRGAASEVHATSSLVC